MAHQDQTTIDNDRRELTLHKAEIERVLPEYFQTEYPDLIQLLEAYYEWMDSDRNPDNIIHNLYRTRDITQTRDDLLEYLEDELLLGQGYFGGWINKREAIKFSNNLYRTKGTKYSIEQFFKGFYGIDVDVLFPKNEILKTQLTSYNEDGILSSETETTLNLADGGLGAKLTSASIRESKFQEFSILIRSELNVSTWIDNYKLFVHPAGVEVSGTILVVSTNEPLDIETPDISQVLVTTDVYESVATLGASTSYVTAARTVDSDGTSVTLDPYRTMEAFSAIEIDTANDNYGQIDSALDLDGIYLDDSDMSIDNTLLETIDRSKFR